MNAFKNSIRLPPLLFRQSSSNIGNQSGERTCFAHSTARVIARLFKVTYPKYFSIDNESCSVYYNTIKCLNVFKCFGDERRMRMNSAPQMTCRTETDLDDEGWKKENISALLFTYIYKLITAEYGCDTGYTEDAYKFVFSHLKNPSNFTEDLVTYVCTEGQELSMSLALIGGWTLDIDKRLEELAYHEKLIEQLVGILKNISADLTTGTLKTSLFFSIYTKNDRKDASWSDDLITCLFQGFYATISLYDHAITVIDYENIDGDYNLIVKNSWGDANTWTENGNIIIKDNRISLRSLAEIDKEVGVHFIEVEPVHKGGSRKKRKSKKRKSKKRCKGGGIGSSRAKREDNKDESLKNESLKTSPKGPKKKAVSFNNTVKKRKAYEDNNSEEEEEDISDKHKTKNKKTPVKWGKNMKEKNNITLTNLHRAKERAHAINWDNWTIKRKIDRKEYYRREEEINNQMFI